MCQAQATLAYGLTIRTASLYFAAKAWPRLKPVLPFFDLIFLRLRKGVLATSQGKGAVTGVPVEVWEEIRGWLVSEEIADSEDTFVGGLFCDDTRCTLRPPVSERATWKAFCEGNCAICGDSSMDGVKDELFYWSKTLLKAVREPLAFFGLDHPLQKPISLDSDEWGFSNSLALIAAPSRLRDRDPSRNEAPAIAEAACGGDLHSDQQTLIDVSFTLPPNIDQRFIRFIRFFNFEVIHSSVNKLSSNLVFVGADDEERKSKKDNEEKEAGKFSGVQSKVVNKIKPKWKLWMTCVSDW